MSYVFPIVIWSDLGRRTLHLKKPRFTVLKNWSVLFCPVFFKNFNICVRTWKFNFIRNLFSGDHQGWRTEKMVRSIWRSVDPFLPSYKLRLKTDTVDLLTLIIFLRLYFVHSTFSSLKLYIGMLMGYLNFIFFDFSVWKKGFRIQEKVEVRLAVALVRLQTELGFILHNNYVISFVIQHWTKKWNFNYRLNSFYQQACQECQFYFTFEQRVGFGFKSNTHPFSSCRAASKSPNGSFNRNSTQHGQAVTVFKK